MDTLIAILSLVLFLAFIAGLIKPSLVKMPNRKKSSLVYLGGAMVLSVIGSTLYPTERAATASKTTTTTQATKPKEFEFADLSLGEYRGKFQEKRHEIINSYAEYKNIPKAVVDGFYACMSQNAFTKDRELKLKDVLSWCYAAYEKAPDELAKTINIDPFTSNFSGWDGAYRPLEKLIKDNMNDDGSYKHVETFISQLDFTKDPHAIIKTTFKGKNAYGGIVKEAVTARVNLETGEVEKILQDK
ncbi:TPA: hypothetical protein ACOEEV_002047 [Enterobacter roggenkampii]